MVFRHLAQAGQVCFTAGLNRVLEGACHQRNVAGGSDRRVCHHRIRTHLHGLRGLARPADARVDDHRNIGVLDDHLDEVTCAQALIRADHRAERHHACRARVLKTLRCDRVREHVRHDHKALLGQLFRGLDGLLVVWQ